MFDIKTNQINSIKLPFIIQNQDQEKGFGDKTVVPEKGITILATVAISNAGPVSLSQIKSMTNKVVGNLSRVVFLTKEALGLEKPQEKSLLFYSLKKDFYSTKNKIQLLSQRFLENEETKINPYKDTLFTTKEKVRSLLDEISPFTKNLSISKVKKLKAFLKKGNLDEKTWAEIHSGEKNLKSSLLKHCRGLFQEVIEATQTNIEDKRQKLLQELVKKQASAFKTKLTDEEKTLIEKKKGAWAINTYEVDLKDYSKIVRNQDWFYLPLINYFDELEVEIEKRFDDDHRLAVFRLKTQKDSAVLSLGINKRLAKEYKIHLMPKSEYLLDTLEKLLKILEKNPELRSLISAIKITTEIESILYQGTFYTPLIVVYPKLGKENAQIALNGLVKELYPYFKWGTNMVPRFNQAGNNPLIYYSQGDSKRKFELKNEDPETFYKLYDSSGIHFHAEFGDYPLNLPKHY